MAVAMNANEHEAILRTYDAVLDPMALGAGLDALGAIYPDIGLVLLVETMAPRVFSAGFQANFDEDTLRDYAALAPINPIMRHVLEAPLDRAISTDEFLPRREIENSQFYDVFLKQRGRINCVNGFVIRRHGPDVAVVGANIPADFAASDRQRLAATMETVRPHYQQAFALNLQLARRRISEGAGLFLLDQIPTSVLVIDRDKRLLQMNARARRQKALAPRTSLASAAALLPRATAGTTRRIDRAIETAVTARLPSRPITVAREGGRDLVVFITPIPREPAGAPAILDPFLDDAPAAVIYVLDPDEIEPAREDILTGVFRLSPAEARLVQRLGEGYTLKEAAELAETSYATVRTQLARSMEKLDMSRQSDLTAFVTRLSIRTPRNG